MRYDTVRLFYICCCCLLSCYWFSTFQPFITMNYKLGLWYINDGLEAVHVISVLEAQSKDLASLVIFKFFRWMVDIFHSSNPLLSSPSPLLSSPFIIPLFSADSRLPDPWSLLLLFWLKLLNSEVTSSPRTLLQFSMRKRTSSHTYREKHQLVTAWTNFTRLCSAAAASHLFSLLYSWMKVKFYNCLCRGSFADAVPQGTR